MTLFLVALPAAGCSLQESGLRPPGVRDDGGPADGAADAERDAGPLAHDMDGDGFESCVFGVRPTCDCNDCDPGIYPGAFDRCGDGIDADCDGILESCAAGDEDGDGVLAIAAGGSDCDDTNPLVFPGALERCGDGVDDDCDGADADCSADADGDGWIEPAECEGNAAVSPDAAEECNGVDDDCDGTVDEVLLPDGTGSCCPGGCDEAMCA